MNGFLSLFIEFINWGGKLEYWSDSIRACCCCSRFLASCSSLQVGILPPIAGGIGGGGGGGGAAPFEGSERVRQAINKFMNRFSSVLNCFPGEARNHWIYHLDAIFAWLASHKDTCLVTLDWLSGWHCLAFKVIKKVRRFSSEVAMSINRKLHDLGIFSVISKRLVVIDRNYSSLRLTYYSSKASLVKANFFHHHCVKPKRFTLF